MSVVGHSHLPTRWVDLARGPLAYIEDAPSIARRRTVVCVPGYTGSKEDFGPLLPELVAAGHHVVALDQRGQHESPGPDDVSAYAVTELAADLIEFIGAIANGPVHVLGHSFGGLVARAAVIERPELAASLILLSSGPAALSGMRVENMERLTPVLDEVGMEALFDAFAAQDTRLAAMPELRAFLRARWLASSEAGLRGMGAALKSEPDRIPKLRATGVAVLVAHGEHDDAWSPAEQAEMAERLGADHVVIPAAVHSPNTEQPAATAAALSDFWARVEAQPGFGPVA